MNHEPEQMICEKCGDSFKIRLTRNSRKRSGFCAGCVQRCRGAEECMRYSQGVNDEGLRVCRAHGAPPYVAYSKGDANRYRFGNR